MPQVRARPCGFWTCDRQVSRADEISGRKNASLAVAVNGLVVDKRVDCARDGDARDPVIRGPTVRSRSSCRDVQWTTIRAVPALLNQLWGAQLPRQLM